MKGGLRMSEVKFSRFSVDAVFSQVKTGDYHASSHLESGDVPLISCKTEEHGVEGYFKIPLPKTYENCVTIACDGTPLTSFYHPYRFAAKDNVLVCIPREGVKLSTIFYTIAYLNRERWRFSYGRKSYMNKVKKLSVLFPINNEGKIDQDKIADVLKNATIQKFLPSKTNKVEIPEPKLKYAHVGITDVFELHSGDYHNASELPDGKIPLISCGETGNGLVKYCSVPKNMIYANTLTIAYNGRPLTTKYHPYRFAAKDDVAVCIPKKLLKTSTLIFIQYIINRQIWRYSYGRKCFREKLSKLQIHVPIDEHGDIDEEAIEKIVSNTSYWDYLRKQGNEVC